MHRTDSRSKLLMQGVGNFVPITPPPSISPPTNGSRLPWLRSRGRTIILSMVIVCILCYCLELVYLTYYSSAVLPAKSTYAFLTGFRVKHHVPFRNIKTERKSSKQNRSVYKQKDRETNNTAQAPSVRVSKNKPHLPVIEYSGDVNLKIPKWSTGNVTRLPPAKSSKEILDRLAIGIKTFNRPDCLKTTVNSFYAHYPKIPIFVADDSFNDDVKNIDNIHQYIRLPPESGVAYGRNVLVNEVYKAGYEYIIISDDDFTLDKSDDVTKLADYLLQTNADILAPTRCDYGECGRSKGVIHVDDKGHMVLLPNITKYKEEPIKTCVRSDIIQQFFLTKTVTLMNTGWDAHLKNNDHYDFLLNCRKNQLKLISCSDIHVNHNKIKCQAKSVYNKEYGNTRNSRWYSLVPYVLKKWNLTKITDETGKKIWLDENNNALHKFAKEVAITRHHKKYDYFLNSIVSRLNAKRPSWRWIGAIEYSKWTKIKYTKFNTCLNRVRGKIGVNYDRWKTYENDKFTIRFNMFLFNTSCTFAEDVWRVTHYEKEEMRHVYYVVTVANDRVHLDRLLSNLGKSSKQDFVNSTIVIVDMNTSLGKIKIHSIPAVSINVQILHIGAPFSRSIGLRKGINFARELSAKRGQENPIVFAIDTSIVPPSYFSKIIRHNTRCGLSAFAPICYKFRPEKEDFGGFWVNAGYGMVGMCLSDYDNTGGYDVKWGYRWGAEDVDLLQRLQSRANLKYIMRIRLDGFHHIHDDDRKKKNKSYYTKKNVYKGELPITPLSINVSDKILKKRLFNFVSTDRKLKGLEYSFTLKRIMQTQVNEKIWYDIRLQDQYGHHHSVIVESPFV